MTGADWKQRYAALITLGAIIEGPERKAFKDTLNPGLANLINMFKDQSMKVREACSWVFCKICEHHADVLSNNAELMPYFVAQLCESLQDKPRISIQCCLAIEKFCQSIAPLSEEEEEFQSNVLTPHFAMMAKSLIDNAERTDNEGTQLNLCRTSYTALTTLT